MNNLGLKRENIKIEKLPLNMYYLIYSEKALCKKPLQRAYEYCKSDPKGIRTPTASVKGW